MTGQESFSREPLEGFLADLTLGGPLRLGDLTVVPVFSARSHSPEYLALPAALSSGPAS